MRSDRLKCLYMTIVITLLSILQAFSVSLGVGSSTLAIINFFVAIADGKIDETERRMMGVVYVVLRVAMVAILLTSLALVAIQLLTNPLSELTTVTYGVLIVLAVLFANAVLMTLHLMPSTFGPSIQAGSWYTLGTLMALQSLQITDFSLVVLSFAYLTWLVLATAIVNGIMAWLKAQKHNLLK